MDFLTTLFLLFISINMINATKIMKSHDLKVCILMIAFIVLWWTLICVTYQYLVSWGLV